MTDRSSKSVDLLAAMPVLLVLSLAIFCKVCDLADRSDTILDQPDGQVTSVDDERGEVQVDINRAMGAHAQLRVSVFDANATKICAERPKGIIELTRIGDTFSIGRITRTADPAHPIRIGDIIYAGGSPSPPSERFALIGKIDINRDGKDDREALKQMIRETGGVVAFDLPPPEVGQETGRITPWIDWYVIDNRIPMRQVLARKPSDAGLSRQVEWQKRVGAAIREARLDGIRPMPISRLLEFLGARINMPSDRPGR